MNLIQKSIIYAILFALLGICSCSQEMDTSPKEFTKRSGEYFGQDKPGLKPEIFVNGIVSTDEHRERDITFAGDLREFYFTRNSSIMVSREIDGVWSEPEVASFSGDYQEFEGFLTQDGSRLYYISGRPLSGKGDPEDFQIWYVDRSSAGWSEPVRLSDGREYFPTLTSDGVMYLTSSDQDLFRVEMNGDQLGTYESLGDSVNTAQGEYNALISPDESFIIFTSHGWGPGFGAGDLLVSFRKEGNTWSRPRNLGPGINTSALEYCPGLSPDGKYFFFVSLRDGNSKIYWVSAERIELARTEDLDLSLRVYEAVVEGGVEAGLAELDRISAEYAEYCDFDGDMLLGVSDRLLAEGKTGMAASVTRSCFELYPQRQTLSRKLQLAVISDDKEMFDRIALELKSTSATLDQVDENTLNLLGYQMLWRDRVDDAVQLFALNTELFPNSANTFDSYGEGLLARGDTTAAILNYQKSLELNPQNTNAEDVLVGLGVSTLQ